MKAKKSIDPLLSGTKFLREASENLQNEYCGKAIAEPKELVIIEKGK